MEKKILFWFYWEMYFLFINSISFVKLTTASSLLIYCILFNFIYLAKYPLSLLQKSCFICCLFHPNCKWVPLNHLNQYHSYKCQNSHSYLSILFSIWIRSEALLLKKNLPTEMIWNFHRTFQMDFVNGNLVKPQYVQTSKMIWVVFFFFFSIPNWNWTLCHLWLENLLPTLLSSVEHNSVLKQY